jgi:hypothetical protein
MFNKKQLLDGGAAAATGAASAALTAPATSGSGYTRYDTYGGEGGNSSTYWMNSAGDMRYDDPDAEANFLAQRAANPSTDSFETEWAQSTEHGEMGSTTYYTDPVSGQRETYDGARILNQFYSTRDNPDIQARINDTANMTGAGIAQTAPLLQRRGLVDNATLQQNSGVRELGGRGYWLDEGGQFHDPMQSDWDVLRGLSPVIMGVAGYAAAAASAASAAGSASAAAGGTTGAAGTTAASGSLMPAAVAESSTALTAQGLTQTAPGVWAGAGATGYGAAGGAASSALLEGGASELGTVSAGGNTGATTSSLSNTASTGSTLNSGASTLSTASRYASLAGDAMTGMSALALLGGGAAAGEPEMPSVDDAPLPQRGEIEAPRNETRGMETRAQRLNAQARAAGAQRSGNMQDTRGKRPKAPKVRGAARQELYGDR